MTLAVILPLVSTYRSTGVPSGVLPKSILSTLLWLWKFPATDAASAIAGEPDSQNRIAAATVNALRLGMRHFLLHDP